MTILFSSLGFLAYLKYPYAKDKLYSYFLPINDSLFENVKLLWTGYMLIGMLVYWIFYTELPLSYMVGLFVSASIAVILLALLLVLIDLITETCLPTTIFAYVIANMSAQLVNYFILMTNFQNYYIIMASVIILILITTIMAYFTYDNIASSIAWEEET